MELLENSSQNKKVQQPINLKKVIWKYLKKWPWFLLSLGVFYTAARIYLRYAEPQYYTKTSLKLQESKGKSTALSDLKNLGMGVSGDNELQGETTVIVSKPILTTVVQKLNLGVSFFSIGSIKEVELYGEYSPFTGKILKVTNPEKFFTTTFTMNPVGRNSYKLSGINNVFRFGSTAELPFGTVQIDAKYGVGNSEPIKVVFRSDKSVVGSLEGSINVNLPENKGLLMDVSIVGPVPKKSEDILNELGKQYIIDGVNDKNLEAQSTQNFINDRLEIITEDLSGIEGEKENFKRSNQITNLEAQANIALGNSQENTKIILEKSMQLDLINSMISASSSDQLLPAGMGFSASAETSISEYNNLVLTKNRVLKQATPENPAVIEMTKQIAVLKNVLRKNLIESRETLQLELGQANAQLNVAKGNISKYPTQEKIFRSIDRQQTLKEQLYLYLLQKREENAITLAVTAPKAKVINPAFTTGIVKPNRQQIIFGSLAAGFLVPLLVILILTVLDTKVRTKQEIISLQPEATVIAEIPLNTALSPIVNSNDFSVFAESFRILSSNLKYIIKAKQIKNGAVILVTSSVKGEGKTTVSMNTALTLSGKSKTIIVGADIRNPQLHRFVTGVNKGLTDYLVSDYEQPDSFIVPSNLNDNLDVLFSGQIAPNPNDLLDMNKFDEMITHLKDRYDYVILDSAPVMLVSDTLHLIENSDVVLYIVKSGVTENEMIDFAAGFQKENQIKSLSYILNGVQPENTRYGKKYGYGYYSYTHDDQPKWWKRFI